MSILGNTVSESALAYPSDALRCRRGDHILHASESGSIHVFRVDDVVKLVRLIPSGHEHVVEEHTLLDSERPAYMDEIHLLLTAFEPEYRSFEDAAEAIDAGELRAHAEMLCRNLAEFTLSRSRVHRSAMLTA